MGFSGNLEILKQYVRKILLKFNKEVFIIQKKHVEQRLNSKTGKGTVSVENENQGK